MHTNNVQIEPFLPTNRYPVQYANRLDLASHPKLYDIFRQQLPDVAGAWCS